MASTRSPRLRASYHYSSSEEPPPSTSGLVLKRWVQENMNISNSVDVGEWLKELGLEQYRNLFYQAGYDDVFVISLLEERDLVELQIKKKAHIMKILFYAKDLVKRLDALFVDFYEEYRRSKLKPPLSASDDNLSAQAGYELETESQIIEQTKAQFLAHQLQLRQQEEERLKHTLSETALGAPSKPLPPLCPQKEQSTLNSASLPDTDLSEFISTLPRTVSLQTLESKPTATDEAKVLPDSLSGQEKKSGSPPRVTLSLPRTPSDSKPSSALNEKEYANLSLEKIRAIRAFFDTILKEKAATGKQKMFTVHRRSLSNNLSALTKDDRNPQQKDKFASVATPVAPEIEYRNPPSPAAVNRALDARQSSTKMTKRSGLPSLTPITIPLMSSDDPKVDEVLGLLNILQTTIERFLLEGSNGLSAPGEVKREDENEEIFHFLFISLEKYLQFLSETNNLAPLLLDHRRRAKLEARNSILQSEIKNFLDRSGFDTTEDREALTSRSLQRIEDLLGREMWNLSFSQRKDLNPELIDWSSFVEALAKYLKKSALTKEEESNLKYVLDNYNSGYMTPGSFSDFLKTFGPLPSCIENLQAVIHSKWFHGFLSSEEAGKLLQSKPIGTFLVRFRHSRTSAFAIEFVDEDKTISTVQVLNRLPIGFQITEESGNKETLKTFSSLPSLLDHYKSVLRHPFESDILKSKWFYGNLTREEAEEMLYRRAPGTFLIRFSQSKSPFLFVCSSKDQQQRFNHSLLQQTHEGVCLVLEHVETNEEIQSTAFSLEEGQGSTIYKSLSDYVLHNNRRLLYPYYDLGIPDLDFEPYLNENKNHVIQGPNKTCDFGQNGEIAAAMSALTYPSGCLGHTINCDSYAYESLGNRCVTAIADGCNWGVKPQEASQRASRAFIKFFAHQQLQEVLLNSAKLYDQFDTALHNAHNEILKGKSNPHDAGTTTLLGGILTKAKMTRNEEREVDNGWVFMGVSVGDCKAFVWNRDSKVVTDITATNRGTNDVRLCGGRLGPAMAGGSPDLFNRMYFFWPCQEGDIVLLMTDGIHDNLDPENLGQSPSDFGLPFTDWKTMPIAQAEKQKALIRETLITNLVNQCADATPKAFTEVLMKYCYSITKKKRDFMQQYSNKPEPKDLVSFPGKMDHITVISILVGDPGQKKQMDLIHNWERVRGLLDHLVPSVVKKVPSLEVLPSTPSVDSLYVQGPSQKSSKYTYQDWIASDIVSLYPSKTDTHGNKKKSGDPASDFFSLYITPTRWTVVLTGGTSWGSKAREASCRANTTFIESVLQVNHMINNTKLSLELQAKALYNSYRDITRSKTNIWDAGTTALVAGQLLKLRADQPNKWVFVGVVVGNCKAFHFKAKAKSVHDITPGRSAGRLGPYLEDAVPDLSDFNTFYLNCDEGDLILLTTDGTHDNFDPLYLGNRANESSDETSIGIPGLVPPPSLSTGASASSLSSALGSQSLPSSSLSSSPSPSSSLASALSPAQSSYSTTSPLCSGGEMDSIRAAKMTVEQRDRYRLHKMSEILQQAKFDPSQLSSVITSYCYNLTRKSREYLEQNWNKQSPQDRNRFPGRIDHATCLCFKVGNPIGPRKRSLTQSNSFFQPMKIGKS